MNIDEKRLFLLDAYALIYRAYYALIRAPRITSKGFNTSAIFGFCNTLEEILRKEAPTHIAVCFDPPGGDTFRHEMYPLYKAQRDKQPEDITQSVPVIKEILAAYRIPVVEVARYEADDVIGTLSKMAEAEGYMTYMMTPDKDYGQLVTDRVVMYRPALRGEGFEVRGPQQVCERYGISSPSQVIDLLALEGDASDNVPGCPGVGEKTASKLIAEWGSVENLLANTDRLKGALQKKIVDNAEQIRFSKELVTIKTDVPLPESLTIASLRRRPEDAEALLEIFRRLEFRTFIKKMSKSETSAPAEASPAPEHQGMGSLFDFDDSASDAGGPALARSIDTVGHTYTVASTPEAVAEAVADAAKAKAAGLFLLADTDAADAAEAMTSRIVGAAISTEAHKAVYIPFDTDGTDASLLAPLLSTPTLTICAYDIKRSMLLLAGAGLEIEAPYFDIAVAHYLLEPEGKHTPTMLALKYLDYDLIQPAGKQMLSPDASRAADFACERADTALRLHSLLWDAIDREGMTSLLRDIELPMVRVLAHMEWTGVCVDSAELAQLSLQYTKRLNAMEDEVYEMAGMRFNIASPMQVGDILFDRLRIDPAAKRTKRGFFSTTEEILEKHRASHPIVDLILKIRALRKLLSTYINQLPAMVNPATGRIHTTYNQTVTATGRISSTNPNLQNIPVRSDDGREIRRAFVPSPGNLLLSADYSQIELRLMAEMSADPAMVEAFHSGADIHRATAAKIYHVALDDVTDTQRRNAKTANFGIIYGISAFGLSERLNIPRGEAKTLIEGYFANYPGVKRYIERSIETAREKGYVTTLMGRRRMLPEISSRNAVVRGYAERNAVNAPLQGSAADIIKIAMVRIFDRMRRLQMKSRMIMQVHDELIFDVVPEEMEALRLLVVEEMADAHRGVIAMEVSVGTGHNWLEAH
ncbi:MAG: DNA polymerase I [Paramuribaculum sp.]|nr:DNA polymerase I [Paramuribaculum sp.]